MRIVLTKEQIEIIKTTIAFNKLEQIELDYSSPSGIGPSVLVILPNSSPVDITDISNW